MNRRRQINGRNWLARLLDAAQRRFSRARPGSVLVMVVALLVMLALIGTAAMSTARLDRMSSVQHVANTEIDMLAESVKQMVIGQLVTDLFSARGPNLQDSPFSDPDFFKETQDAILGVRNPERQLLFSNLPDPLNQVPKPSRSTYLWRSIGYPAIQNGNPFKFDVPTEDSSDPVYYGMFFPKLGMVPTSVTLNGELMPALQAVDLVTGSPVTSIQTPDMTAPKPYRAGQPFLAADTDGDGIADAVLFKLPVSPIAGVTFYAGTRVIDNGSAINLNTAWNPNYEFAKVKTRTGTTDASIAGTYPASVMLENLLSPSTSVDTSEAPQLSEMMKVNNQRVYGNRLQSNSALNFSGSLKPVGDNGANGTVRNDFMFLTVGDMLHNQLGRRLDYPGYILDPMGGGNILLGKGTRPFGIGDSMALAYRFTLLNSGSQGSVVEKVLFNSAVNNNKNSTTPYFANDAQTWFIQNFDYRNNPPIIDQNANPPTLLRSLFTTINPVSNGVVRHMPDPTHSFQSIPRVPGAAIVPTNGVYPTKTNLNTATFEELWRSFYDVMSATDNNSHFDFGMDDNIYQGMAFGNNFEPTNDQHQARMFRSPMRPIGGTAATPRLHPYQVMALRAAIAAANVMALREDDDTHVPFFDIVLPQAPQKSPAGTPFFSHASATVYGIKRQPFITEVFLNNNPEKQFPAPQPPVDQNNPQPQNPSGFAALEIHNPYDTDMDIGDWKLALINRRGETNWSNPALQIQDLPDNSWAHAAAGDPLPANPPVPFSFPPGFTIPAHGYVVVTNYASTNPPVAPPPPPTDPDAAQYLPADLATGSNRIQTPPLNGTVYLKTLHYAMNNEIVLMRPVKAVPPNSPPGTGATTVRWAPVDSFDCTGLAHQVAPGANAQPTATAEGWHYVRANDPGAGKAWHFVYPGRYDATNSRPHQGTEQETWGDPAMTPEPWAPAGPPSKSQFGVADPANSRDSAPTKNSFPIQIANSDLDMQLYDAATNKRTFPLHGFLRAGDVMEATYIGSYNIWGVDTSAPTTNLAPVGAAPGLNGPYAELNGLTIDAAFAEDTDPLDDVPSSTTGQPLEDIGRFSPLFTFDGSLLFDLNAKHYFGNVTKLPSDPDTVIKDLRITQPNDFWKGYDVVVYNGDQSPTSPWTVQFRSVTASSYDPNLRTGSITVNSAFNPPLKGGERYELRYFRYGWAEHILDYFTTISAPADDYLPNKDPLAGTPTAEPVRNAPGTPTQVNRTDPNSTEDNVPSEGLININSAGWKTLASLPMVLDTAGNLDPVGNERLARQIAYYRDVDDIPRPAPGNPPPHPHGPFRSPMELLLVPNFMNAMGTLTANSAGPIQGDFSTMNSPPDDHVVGDFEKKFLALNRISNLITTRSDAFTAYIQVQGWRDAGTPNAKLVAQRRLAFIVDRSRVTATKKTPAVYNVPTAN